MKPEHALLFIVTMIVLLVGIMLPITLSKPPSGLKPGDEVYILTGQTILEDGKACQQYYHGQISPTSPENKQRWHRLPTLLFPTYRHLSIIFDSGKIEWVADGLVVKPDFATLVCTNPISHE